MFSNICASLLARAVLWWELRSTTSASGSASSMAARTASLSAPSSSVATICVSGSASMAQALMSR